MCFIDVVNEDIPEDFLNEHFSILLGTVIELVERFGVPTVHNQNHRLQKAFAAILMDRTRNGKQSHLGRSRDETITKATDRHRQGIRRKENYADLYPEGQEKFAQLSRYEQNYWYKNLQKAVKARREADGFKTAEKYKDSPRPSKTAKFRRRKPLRNS